MISEHSCNPLEIIIKLSSINIPGIRTEVHQVFGCTVEYPELRIVAILPPIFGGPSGYEDCLMPQESESSDRFTMSTQDVLSAGGLSSVIGAPHDSALPNLGG